MTCHWQHWKFQLRDGANVLGGDEVHEGLLDHGRRQPIFSAHLVKTTQAVEEELSVASDSCRRYLLAGLNRFLHLPLKQKHVRRFARQAIALVSRDFA